MAIRYAHGRSTYAPSMVRDSVNKFKTIFPDWKPRKDIVINPPEEDEIGGMRFRSDYLDDLFLDEKVYNVSSNDNVIDLNKNE